MSRTIKNIYEEAVKERNKRLELQEFTSNSRVSILNAITWTVAAIIYSFETILDVFAVDISNTINNRINGTPVFYVNALYQYQKGDSLSISDDGLRFGYASIDETKRIITQVAYSESSDDNNLDNKLILKIATGTKGELKAITPADLVQINAYLNKIAFAGTRLEVTSQEGDVLIPRITIFHDGAIQESELLDSIEAKLNDYIITIPFDASVYVSEIISAIKRVDHVTDAYIDESAIPEQGIFIASYNSDGFLQAATKIKRLTRIAAGFLKQSNRDGQEKELPTFREALILKIEQ